MKIAYFGHKPPPGGKGGGLVTYSTEILRALKSQRSDVIFFFHGPRTRRRRGAKEIQIGSVNILNKSMVAMPDARRHITETLAAERPQVAHVSLSFSQLDFSLPEICHDLGIPVVATLHFPYNRRSTFWGSASRGLHRVYATPLSKYDGIVVFSEEQKALLVGYGVPEQRLHVIPNGVDVTRFRPGEPVYKRQLEADHIVTYMGRIDPEKNVDALLAVYDELGFPPSYRCIVVGDGSDFDRLRERFTHNPQIHFTGWIESDEQRIRILQSTDVFVLPSDVEGLSLAMLEGMACGCAVIATDAGADGEALADSGLLIDAETLVPQLRLALRMLVTHRDFGRTLGAAARARAESAYSIERNVNQLFALYRHVMDGTRMDAIA